MLPSNVKVMGAFCASWAEETFVFSGWFLGYHPILSHHGISIQPVILGSTASCQGILPHIDLLKFDEPVLGISLATEATMIFRQSLMVIPV